MGTMNENVGAGRSHDRLVQRVVVGLIVAGVALWTVVGPMTKTPVHIDEGHHAVGARFVLLGSEHFFRPEVLVGGWQPWEHEAVRTFTFPPLANAVFASSLGMFGLNSVGWGLPLLLAGLLTAGAVFLLGRRLWDRRTGLLSAAVFLWCAATIREGSQFECEPMLVAFSTLAVALVAEGTARRRWWWFAAGGVALGLAFLLKLWLALLIGLILIPFFLRGLREVGIKRTLGNGIVFALAALIAGGSHLALIAIFQPEDLPHWSHIYLRSIVERAGVAGDTPIYYYPALLYRDAGVLILPFSLALAELFGARRSRTNEDRTRRGYLLAGVLTFVSLYAFSKKESAYLYPLYPLVLPFAGRGLDRLIHMIEGDREGTRDERPRSLFFAMGSLMLLCVIAVIALSLSGPRAQGLQTIDVLTHTILMTLAALAAFVLARSHGVQAPRWAVASFAAIVVAYGLLAGARVVRLHQTSPAPPIAAFFADPPSAATEATPPGPGSTRVRFVASCWHPLSALLWQRGRSWYRLSDLGRPWREVAAELEPSVRFFEIDRHYRRCTGCPPDPKTHEEILEWLRANADDITEEIERTTGRHLDALVFRRRGAPHP